MLTEYDILARDYQQAQVRCIAFTKNVLCSFGVDHYSLFLCIRCKMQQGVSPVNFLSFVAVGHLFSVFPFLDNYFLVSIDKKYQFFFWEGVVRLYNKTGVSSYWTGTRQFFLITIIIIVSFLGIQEGNSWKAWVVRDWND